MKMVSLETSTESAKKLSLAVRVGFYSVHRSDYVSGSLRIIAKVASVLTQSQFEKRHEKTQFFRSPATIRYRSIRSVLSIPHYIRCMRRHIPYINLTRKFSAGAGECPCCVLDRENDVRTEDPFYENAGAEHNATRLYIEVRWNAHTRRPTVIFCLLIVLFYSNQGCARDLLSRDRDATRDPCLRNRDETETFKILSETRPRRDVAASETLVKINVSGRRFAWHMVKHIDNEEKLYGLINSHHGTRFLFDIVGFLHFILTIITE